MRSLGGRKQPARRSTGVAVTPEWPWPTFLIALFCLALLWRLAYLGRLAHSPLAGTLLADSLIYWDWAGWIREHGVVGSRPFFLGPLYPYALALLRLFLGDSIERVLVVQAVWGSVAVVLLADASRRLAGTLGAALAGFILCFYQMAVFFDGLVLMESLLFLFEAGLLWWVARTGWSSAGIREFLVAGLLVGFLAEGRATAVLLLVPLVFTLGSGSLRRRSAIAATIGGFALVVLPVAARNAAVSREWIPFTYNFGYNLYVGNNPEATGASVPITGTYLGITYGGAGDGGTEMDGRAYLARSEHVLLSPAASSRYWAAKAARHATRHPPETAALALRKLGMFWSRREYSQIFGAQDLGELAGPLGLPIAGEFALLGALGFGGLWLAARRGPVGSFTVGYALAMSIAVVPFFITDRYRIHLVPALALSAAVLLSRLRDAALSRHARALIRPGLALLAGLAVVHLPAPHATGATAEWIAAVDGGHRLFMQGRPEPAKREFQRAIALERANAIDVGGSTATRAARAELYFSLASALRADGRAGERLQWFESAAREAPDNPVTVRALADAYASSGRIRRADSTYALLDSLSGGDGLVAASRGWQAARAGQLVEAERLFARAVGRAPQLFEAWGALIRIQAQLDRRADAERTLMRARFFGLPSPSLHAHEALLAAMRGDRPTAMTALGDIAPGALRADPTLAEVASIARRLMDPTQP